MYAQLRELLSLEHSEREAQSSYLRNAAADELQALRERSAAELAERDRLHEALLGERVAFGEKLAASLTAYLKGELTARAARISALEKELRATQAAVRDLRAAHESGADERRAQLHQTLEPLAAQVGALEQASAAMAAERQALADNDPRRLLERQQRMVDAALDDARRDR